MRGTEYKRNKYVIKKDNKVVAVVGKSGRYKMVAEVGKSGRYKMVAVVKKSGYIRAFKCNTFGSNEATLSDLTFAVCAKTCQVWGAHRGTLMERLDFCVSTVRAKFGRTPQERPCSSGIFVFPHFVPSLDAHRRNAHAAAAFSCFCIFAAFVPKSPDPRSHE